MPDLTSTDLLVAAAIIDVHGGTRLRPLADRLTQAAAELAMQAAARFEEDMDNVLAILADTPVPLDRVERDRAAVAAVVADWDTRSVRTSSRPPHLPDLPLTDGGLTA